MSEAVIIQLIASAAVVLVAIIGGLFGIFHVKRQKRRDAAISEKIEVVRGQVQNDHGTNLRDDIDRVLAHLQRQDQAIAATSSDIRGLRRDVGRSQDQTLEVRRDVTNLSRRFERHDAWARRQADRIDSLEDTIEVTKE